MSKQTVSRDPGETNLCVFALTYLQSCGRFLGHSISILWLHPCLPTASRRPRRERAISSHALRDMRVKVPREWIFFARRVARPGGVGARVRFRFSPNRIGQPSHAASRRATSTRGSSSFLGSGSMGTAHGERAEAEFNSVCSRRRKRILRRTPPARPPAIRIYSVEYGCC